MATAHVDRTGTPLRVIGGVTMLLAMATGAPAQEVRFDFEDGTLQGWQVVAGEFPRLLTDRADFHHGAGPYNKQGVFFLSSLEQANGKPNDRTTGVAESPVFTLAAAEMSMLVGGGRRETTRIALCTLDGVEVRQARGQDAQPMVRVAWRAPELVGHQVFLRLVDRHQGGWGHIVLDDFAARGTIDPEATAVRFAAAARERQRQATLGGLRACDPAPLRAAVEHLTAEFPQRYPRGKDYLARLDAIEASLAGIGAELEQDAIDPARAEPVFASFAELRLQALMDNPLLRERPILFVTRRQYRSDHHNTATLFQTGEVNTFKFDGGSALQTIDFGAGGAVQTLLASDAGIIRDPELHFDGARIVFSMRRNIDDDYHLYEIGVDGSGLRQLTAGAGVADIDPLYLPDDSIAFSSTREPKFCMCNQHIMANLFAMDADGANITQIGKSTLFEGHGALLPDGRILYDRWEYVDRNFGDAQGLWTVNPDGTNPAVFWGNNLNSPGGVIDARPIPGTPRTLCIFGSCHDRPWGAVAIIDRRFGLDDRRAVVRTWPPDAIERVGRGNWDAFLPVRPKYEDPWPLSDEYFLASRMTGDGEEMGLVLFDVFGNELVVHEQAPGCYDPMPVGPWPRPHVLPSRRDLAKTNGQFFVADVYEGTHMRGIERGSVSLLRVVESPEKRFFTGPAWGGQGVQRPAMNWHDFNNKRILGTVPVEADGSAYFTVPADTFVYFQLLDDDGMMVQSMRSGTMVQAGEMAGCIGCHEDRRSAPPTRIYAPPLAVRRAPSTLQGWHGPPRLFNYMAEVQPVFDRHCVSCHDYGETAGKVLNLAADRTMTFNTSYNELWRKGYVAAIGAGPSATQEPRTWGSHVSRLVSTLRDGHEAHEDVALAPEELAAIITWIDLNAPFYPRYDSAFPDNLAGRSPLTEAQTRRLGALTGVPFSELASHDKNRGPQVSFDRPELSPCLGAVRDRTGMFQEALDLIRAGAAVLRQRPRADMAEFVPCAEDLRRERVYVQRRRIEEQNRAAARERDKVHGGGRD